MTISISLIFMSIPVSKINIGAYAKPYSGIGVEFDPPGINKSSDVPVLHEAGYVTNNSNWNFPNVHSPFWRIYYNFDAGHCLSLNGELHELLPDRIIIIPDHILFHCIGTTAVRNFWLHFSMPNRISPHQQVPIILPPEPAESDLIQTLADRIEQDREAADNIFHKSMALIHLLLAKADIQWAQPLPEPVQNVLRFIEMHIHEPLSNRQLAQTIGVSIETLSRMFRTHLQTSPGQYVNQIRIRKAGDLLEQTPLSIEQIAEQTGFPNRAYFSRVFKQISTMSPAAFRDRKQKHRSQFKH